MKKNNKVLLFLIIYNNTNWVISKDGSWIKKIIVEIKRRFLY